MHLPPPLLPLMLVAAGQLQNSCHCLGLLARVIVMAMAIAILAIIATTIKAQQLLK